MAPIRWPYERNVQLSPRYEKDYVELLEAVAHTQRVTPRTLTLFWPKVGRRYDGDLLVVGRAVNGWIDHWDLDAPSDLAALARAARVTAEGDVNGDPLGWVLDRWKRRDGGYDTSTSQFWETIRRIVTDGHPERDRDWPSHITWTNLGKLAPADGGNPGSALLRVQRQVAPALLKREVDELAPKRVVALIGRWWFEPFAEALRLAMSSRTGLVEGVATEAGRRWVVAVHPMTRSPRAVAEAVARALAQGASVTRSGGLL